MAQRQVVLKRDLARSRPRYTATRADSQLVTSVTYAGETF